MALPALLAVGMGIQAVTGIAGSVMGLINQNKQAEEQKKATEKWEKEKANMTQQFMAQSGLGNNIGSATGGQQMGQGPFPPGM